MQLLTALGLFVVAAVCLYVARVLGTGFAALANAFRTGSAAPSLDAERLAGLEADAKALRRAFADLDDTVEHRFNKLSARAKREAAAAAPAEAAELPGDPAQADLPFGAANVRAFGRPSPGEPAAVPSPLAGFGRARYGR